MKLLSVSLCAAMAATSAASASDLQVALRQELKVLKAEEAQLTSSMKQAERNAATAKRALTSDIDRLTKQLVELRVRTQDATKAMPDAERLHLAEDQESRLEQLEERIKASASRRGVVDGKLAVVFEQVLVHVRREGGLSRRSLEWFDAEGKRQTGEVLRVGEVGALTWSEPSRPLLRLPSGDWSVVPGASATAHSSAEPGVVVELVLFDPAAPPGLEQFRGRGLSDWVRAGGFAMWPLLLIALAAALIALERLWAQFMFGRRVRAFVAEPKSRPDHPALARVFDAVAHPELQLTETLERTRVYVLRGLSFLSLAAAVSPLLGLLGTVTGMIGTFAVITEHGTGDPRLLSGGISEALITTQLGLVVAVFALMLHALLRRYALAHLTSIEDVVAGQLTRETK